MSRFLLSTVLLAAITGCTRKFADADSYRPSMTQLRIGEVVVDDPPVIPEDEYIPGIVIAPDDVFYDDDANQRRADSNHARLSDFSYMKELENPAALDKHAEEYKYTLLPGSLEDEHDDNGIDFQDVKQGAIGDCYFAAGLTSVVFADNDNAIRDGMVREFHDDKGNLSHYVVRFYDAWGDPQDVEVDAQLVRRSGKPLYMRSADSQTDAEELWPGIVEKAYAKWHGNFEKIGNGGFPGDVLQALTGAQANSRRIKYQSEASMHTAITDAIAANRPIAAWTFGDSSGIEYDGTGVYGSHAYTVMDSELTEDGEYRVKLRNPWGSSEPTGPDNGPDDGIFWFSYRDFYTYYSSIALGGEYTRDVTAPASVTDLTLVNVGNELAVKFTATGDDATSGLAASYDLRILRGEIGDDNFLDGDRIVTGDPQAPGTEVTIALDDLSPGTYTVAIRVGDESGNFSPLSNVLNIDLGSDEPPTPPALDDPYWDFSSGDGGWNATGDWGFTGYDWYLGDVSTGTYDFGRAVHGRLESPQVDLSAFATPYIIWEHILDVEGGSEYDQAHIEISADGFVTSTVIWDKVTTGDAKVLDYVYLDAYEGQTVQFAFVFDSVDEQSNDTIGWRVNTVIVDSE